MGVITATIKWKDTNKTEKVVFALSLDKSKYNDNEIFFYCDGFDGFLRLKSISFGEDFEIVDYDYLTFNEYDEQKVESALRTVVKDTLLWYGFLSKYFGISPFNDEKVADLLVPRILSTDNTKIKQAFMECAIESYGSCLVPFSYCDECGKFFFDRFMFNNEHFCSIACLEKHLIKERGLSETDCHDFIVKNLSINEVGGDSIFYLKGRYWY